MPQVRRPKRSPTHLVLSELWKRSPDVLLEAIKRHRGLVGQDVHALRELVRNCNERSGGITESREQGGEEIGVRGAPLGGLGGLREHPLQPPTPQLLSALRGPLWDKVMRGERKRNQSKNPNILDRQPVNKGVKATP